MLALERKHQIYELLKKQHKVVVSDLSKFLNVTEETIRRDLKDLEQKGLLIRGHGGAVLSEAAPANMAFTEREMINFKSKALIGRLAQFLIEDDMLIMVDTSTTAKCIVDSIDQRKQVTILTNSYKLINDLSYKPNLKFIATGGECSFHYKAYIGNDALYTIQKYNADLAILGCNSLTAERGLMESNAEESAVKVAMASHSYRTLVAADYSKFDHFSRFNTLSFNQINFFATDVRPSPVWTEVFDRYEIKLICPDENAPDDQIRAQV